MTETIRVNGRGGKIRKIGIGEAEFKYHGQYSDIRVRRSPITSSIHLTLTDGVSVTLSDFSERNIDALLRGLGEM